MGGVVRGIIEVEDREHLLDDLDPSKERIGECKHQR